MMGTLTKAVYTVIFIDQVLALGEDGTIVLSVFVPVIVLVIITVLLKVLWDWYQEQQVDEFIYDPFLDQMLKSRFPAIVVPPKSIGRVVSSTVDYPQTLDPLPLQERSFFMLQNENCIQNIDMPLSALYNSYECLQVLPVKTEPKGLPTVSELVCKESIKSMDTDLHRYTTDKNTEVPKSVVFPVSNRLLSESENEESGSIAKQEGLSVVRNIDKWQLPKNPYGEKMDDFVRTFAMERESISVPFTETAKRFNRRGFLVKRKKTLHMRFEKKASILQNRLHKRKFSQKTSSRELQKRVNLSERQTRSSISTLCANLELQNSLSENNSSVQKSKLHLKVEKTLKTPKSSLKVRKSSRIGPVKTVTFHKSCKGSGGIFK